MELPVRHDAMTPAASNSLQRLVGILQAYEVSDLSTVAALDFGIIGSGGALLPTVGVTLGGQNPLGGSGSYISARSYDAGTSRWNPRGGTGALVKTLPAPADVRATIGLSGKAEREQPLDYNALELGWDERSATWISPHARSAPTLNLPPGFTFWAAPEIVIPSNTLVVIQPPVTTFVLMAEHLSVGTGVTITWSRSPRQVGTPGRDGFIGQTGTSGVGKATDGAPGGPGGTGGAGEPGWSGGPAPSLEIWILRIDHTMWIDLAGENGGEGGPGGKGGKGGRGGDGSPEQLGLFGVCAAGAGSGGPGGIGGPGGPGGPGGSGGDVQIFAPQDATASFFQNTVIELSPGAGGRGGEGGPGGDPGDGGAAGPRPHHCQPGGNRQIRDGARGATGPAGPRGPDGSPGGHHGTITTTQITQDDWTEEFDLPHVSAPSPTRVGVGSTVTLTGQQFQPTDRVRLADVVCSTTYFSNTLLQFVVPAIAGSVSPPVSGVVIRDDGRATRPFGLEVVPSITAVSPGAAATGQTVSLMGTGIPPTAKVMVADQPQRGVVVADTEHLTFTLQFPPHLTTDGVETATVVLGDGTSSNAVPLRLVASDVVVLGDSIAWGQGLLDTQKWSTLVGEKWSKKLATVIKPMMLAHSGAVIGANDPTLESSLDGEVPTSYPTILEQVQLYPGDGDRVGLVLLNGGINDCNVRTILSPTATESELLKLASQHCNTDMAQLLGEILTTFPLATVCVLGYYQLLSAESLADVDRALLDAALLAFGLPGGIVAALGIDELDAIAARCAAWTAAANQQLALAASQVASVHSRRIVFVDPGFTAANAVLTPESLLFSLNGDLSPQDSVAAARKGVCQSAGARTDEYICERASIGHPNSAGAAKIAGALLAALQL